MLTAQQYKSLEGGTTDTGRPEAVGQDLITAYRMSCVSTNLSAANHLLGVEALRELAKW